MVNAGMAKCCSICVLNCSVPASAGVLPGPYPKAFRFELKTRAHAPITGFPQLSVQRLPNGVVFRGCSPSFIFRPPSLLLPRSFPPPCSLCTGQLGRLPPSLSRFVTSPRIGYTSRPNRATDGGGLSPPRFVALTAAPGTDHDSIASRVAP